MSSHAALVSYWGFDGNASDATGAHNGTLVGGATISGGALRLSADGQYVDFANPTTFDFTTSFTWTARIQTTDSSGAIFSRNPNGAAWNQGSNALFVRGNKVQWDTGWVGNPNTNVTVNDGSWHLVIATYNAGSDLLHIFVDPTVGATTGQYSAEFNVNAFNEHSNSSDTSFTLGKADFSGGLDNLDTLTGWMDDAAIFDTALTGAALNQLISSGAGSFVSQTSPVPEASTSLGLL
ncbi:hypothetical protein HQ447_11410, partial [bacterium]|nr:hypothetical protein [bacterium]